METFNVVGRVINRETKQGIAGLKVEAWDKDLILDDLLGTTVTDQQGSFHIDFSESSFRDLIFFERKPDLFFKLYLADELVASTESSVLWNASLGKKEIVIEVDPSALNNGYKPSYAQQQVLERLITLDTNIELTWDKKKGVLQRIKGMLSGPGSGEPAQLALSFLNENRELFVLDNPLKEMRLSNQTSDRMGNTHIRFQQTYNDLPVFGRELIVHLTHDKRVQGVNGKVEPGLRLPKNPETKPDAALDAALKDDSGNRLHRVHKKPALLVFIDKEGEAHLAWKVIVEGTDKALDGSQTPAVWIYFVDSQTGKIIWRYNNEQTHTNTTGSGIGKYAGSVSLNTYHDHAAGTYKLQDGATPTTARILTYNANNNWPPANLSEDADNNWNAANQGVEVDCHLYSRIWFDYFYTVHGRNSYNNAGADLNIYAHCGVNWTNSSWNGSFVKIGDGDGIGSDAWCTLDIVCHEWTHALTEHTAGLIYSGESGALNESFSDVFAALIEVDWLFGEDNWLKSTAPACRNLADPTNGGQYDPANPITSVLNGHQPDHKNDLYTGAIDNGGVHINSGIMNKAAYLIVTGGTHRGITICEGLGRDVLGRLYYQSLTSHLTSSSNFSDMRSAVLDSLSDLYASDPRYARWRASIINAFAAVGVGTNVVCPSICWIAPGTCPPSPHIICPVSPHLCPPSPHFVCPPSPQFICPPSPQIICPPSPILRCPPSPVYSCFPGPDPTFDPRDIIRDPRDIIRNPVIPIQDVIEVLGIEKEQVKILVASDIRTVQDLINATKVPEQLQGIAKLLGVSETVIADWRARAETLVAK